MSRTFTFQDAMQLASSVTRTGRAYPLKGFEQDLMLALENARTTHDKVLAELFERQDLMAGKNRAHEFCRVASEAASLWNDLSFDEQEWVGNLSAQEQWTAVQPLKPEDISRVFEGIDKTKRIFEDCYWAETRGRPNKLEGLSAFISVLRHFWNDKIESEKFSSDFKYGKPVNSSSKLVVEAALHLQCGYTIRSGSHAWKSV